MGLTQTDKKEIVLLMGEAITELVLPQLNEIRQDVGAVKKDLEKVKEDLFDVQLTANRIETLQKHELNRVDDHEIRIEKLEKAYIIK